MQALPQSLKGFGFAGLLAMLLVACQPQTATPATAKSLIPHGAQTPEQAVNTASALLREDRYADFARASVPAALYQDLQQAWQAGHTRWPLDELPFSSRHPQFIASFAQTAAQAKLRAAFNQHFAGADGDLRNAAEALGIFAVEYLRAENDDLTQNERAHYIQLAEAVSAWAQQAPLSNREKAGLAIARLVQATEASGLQQPQAFAQLGMQQSLQQAAPVLAAIKATLSDYGLSLNAALDSVQVQRVSADDANAADADNVLVAMRYQLAGKEIQAYVPTIRIDGRWYIADFVRRAERAVQAPNRPDADAGKDARDNAQASNLLRS